MKKFVIFSALIGFLVLPVMVFAQGGGPPVQAPDVNVMQVLTLIVHWLFAILLIVAVIFLIIGGFYFITARGDPDKVQQASMMVLWALVGVLVGVSVGVLVKVGVEVGEFVGELVGV